MVKSGIFPPKLTDKQLLSQTSPDARFKNNVVQEKMEKSRGEDQFPLPSDDDDGGGGGNLPSKKFEVPIPLSQKASIKLHALRFPVPRTSSMMDIERRSLAPLVEWQIHRATQEYPHVSLRQQEAMVTEWLHRNHFRVARLPRLDPLILTTRGVDFGKFMNFIYPAPYSLKFKSATNRRKPQKSCSGYEEEMVYAKLREPCPRLHRSERSKTDVFTINPVVRVGGGYKRLTWNTWEVLPAIGQSPDDVTDVFTCTRCGVNLAVPHEIVDNTGTIKLVITYPSYCANCGKEVRSPRNKAPGNIGQHYNTRGQEELGEHLGQQSRDGSKQTGQPYHYDRTLADHVRPRHEDDYSVGSSDDTGFSFTPDGREDSFFITEADGTIKRIKRSLTNRGDEQPTNNSQSLDDMKIIEHRDPESGMKVRFRRKSGKKKNTDDRNEPCVFSGEQERSIGKSGMEPMKKEKNRKGLVIAQGGISSEDYEDSDDYSAFLSRQKKEQRSYQKHKARPASFHYLRTRKALSDSELLIPERYLNFLKRKRVSSKKRSRRSSRHQSNATEKQQGTGNEKEFANEDWKRTATTMVGSNRTANSSSLVEMHNRALQQQGTDNPDGYIADSEEDKDSLLKLQAQLLQLKLDARKKSSGKDKRSRSKEKRSTSRNRSGNEDTKEKKTTQLTKKRSSLSTFGFDSDSWDSDESLHFDPLSDGYYSSEMDEVRYTRRSRPASLDEQNLPSHRNSMISFNNIYAAAAGSSDEGSDDEDEGKDFVIHDAGEKRKKYRRSFKRKPTNKTTKAVPTLPIGSHRPRFSTKWDQDDLSESDIHHLTAQMQTSFQPRKNVESDNNDVEYCKGQYCCRCGSYVNECEATCSACGTYCKRPDAPCKVCRDRCERCGKPKVRCQSRDEGLVARQQEEELQAKSLGMTNEQNEDDQNKVLDDYENEVNDGDEETKDVPGTRASENTIDTERTSTSLRSSKRGRRMIVKKHKKSGSRHTKRGNRQRASTIDTMDSMETVMDSQPLESEGDIERGEEDDNQDMQDGHDEDSQVNKPQPSKYTKSKKRFKPSKMVVSQKVVYRNSSSLSQCSTMDQTIGEDQDDRDDIEEEIEDEKEDKDDEKDETQAPKELTPQEDPKEEAPPQKVENEKAEQVETKTGKVEEPKEEEKPKPQIPKPKLRGVQRVNAAYKERVELNKRLQAMLKDALPNVIAEADIRVRRDSTIDYLAQYRLVDRAKIEVYARAFTLEDEDEKGIINYDQMMLALEGVPTIQGMSRQQMSYVLQVLEVNTFSRVSFKMFAVINALCERVTSLDPFVKELVEGLDLSQTEWKLDMYKNMFYVAGNRAVSFISPADLRIELKAGGLNQKQEDHVIKHITQSSENGQISFLDYMAYLPLFLSIHQNICSNALDMSRDKYTSRKVKTTT